MRRTSMTRARLLGLAAVTALGLLVVAGASAAHPKPGKSYAGFTSEHPFNGYKAPVGFNVSANGKQLLGFRYSAGDCGGMGGSGSPWGNPTFVRKVASIPVDRRGNFSITNARWNSTEPFDPPVAKISLSTIRGHFATARLATGTIRLTVKIGSETCPRPIVRTFKASLR